jgi:methyltransferase (TIGR00027 family)
MRENQPSTTAEAVAFWRALEQRYPAQDRLLEDPFAKALLSRIGRIFFGAQIIPGPLQLMDTWVGGGTLIYTVLRHRWMDEAFIRAGRFSEVLVLGAGYDMRVFRLPELKGVRVIEIDHPATGGRKKRCMKWLAVEDMVERVSVDFAKENLQEALTRIKFTSGGWFFWEGVSMYLPEAAVRETLSTLARWGCSGVLDLYTPPQTGGGIGGAWMRALPSVAGMVGEPVDFRIEPEKIEGFMESCGFKVVEQASSIQMVPAASRRTLKPNPYGFAVRVKPL